MNLCHGCLIKHRLSRAAELPKYGAIPQHLEAQMSVITHDILPASASGSRASTSHPAAMAGWLGRLIGTWRARIRERQAFARLDNRDLRDLGLSRWEVESQVAKPFWRD
jgi:uncharacterized protein YjiS (DUF1127 family)